MRAQTAIRDLYQPDRNPNKMFYRKRLAHCKAEGCLTKTRLGNEYCARHYNECPTCGIRICNKSTHCARHAAPVTRAKYKTNGNVTRPRGNKTRPPLEEALEILECYNLRELEDNYDRAYWVERSDAMRRKIEQLTQGA
jgi:hypothetical protein